MAHLEIIRPERLSAWQRIKRSITLGPWNPKDREIARYFGGTPVTSGVSVNEETVMSYSAVWAAVNLVSAHISSVPLVLFKVLPNGGKDRFEGHPLYRMLHDRPNPIMGSTLFRRTMQANKMVWGNAYAEIERDGGDRPKNLWPLLSYQMQPFFQGGQLKYRYRNQNGADIIFDPQDIVHLRGYSETGIEGSSAVTKGRESFGLAIAAERFGSAFYGNSSTMDGVITYPAGINMTPQAKEDNRKALANRHQGVDRAYRMLALYEGAKYERLGVEPNQAQFLETRMFQIEEVARWFNIPPHKLKHLQRTSYNSIEHQSIEYVTDALDPDWRLWEEELQLKLVSPLEQGLQKIEHIREGMLRGDSAARSQLQSSQFSIASVTPNEVRQMENRNPVPGGDRPFVALNLIPLDLVDDYWKAQIDKAKEPKAAPVPPEAKPKEDDEEVKAARARAQAAEDARDLALDNARRADERAELLATAHTQDRERHAQEVAQLGDALAEANTSLHAAADRVRALEEARANDEQERAMLAAGNAVLQKQATDLEAERAELRLSLSAEQAAKQDAEKAAADARVERDAALALAERAGTLASTLTDRAEAADALIIETREQCEAFRGHWAAAKIDIDTLAAERDTIQAEAETLRTDLARARADLATELDTHQKAKAVTLAAMRSLFVDASERLLQKESDRARKHQATAEKLRAWVETFYPMHEETVRSAFRPLVGAWTAVAGGDGAALLERLVLEHMDTSRRAFARVLDAEDDDERAAVLERTLRRWDEERAEAMADALVREGMAQ
jgi:HK97 family phage portal protein